MKYIENKVTPTGSRWRAFLDSKKKVRFRRTLKGIKFNPPLTVYDGDEVGFVYRAYLSSELRTALKRRLNEPTSYKKRNSSRS